MSDYPTAVDVLPVDVGAKTRSGSGTPEPDPTPSHHSSNHNNANLAIIAIQETLGLNPQGEEDDVAARLDSIEEGGGGGGGVTTKQVEEAVAAEEARAKAAEGGKASKAEVTAAIATAEAASDPAGTAAAAVSGLLSQATADARYLRLAGSTNMLGPWSTGGEAFMPSGTVPIGTANKGLGARYVAKRAGTIKKLYVPVTTAAAGNHVNVAIFDDGSASAGNRKVLYESGSTAVSAASWITLSPELAVTLGQHFDIAVMFDNTTSAVGRFAETSAFLLQLPEGAFVAPGAAPPKIGWEFIGTEFSFGGLAASVKEEKFKTSGSDLSIPQLLLKIE